jgi:hypothetical protein
MERESAERDFICHDSYNGGKFHDEKWGIGSIGENA